MKKFKYRFEALLKEKKIREDQRKREFSFLVHELNQLKSGLDDHKKREEGVSEKLNEEKTKPQLDVQQILEYEHFLKSIKIKMSQQMILIQKAESIVEKGRVALVEAMRKTQVIDKLKQKDHKKYMHEMAQEEVREMDEISMLRFGRKA